MTGEADHHVPNVSADALSNALDRAVLQRHAGQHTGALAILLDLLKTSPTNARVHFELACTYDPQGMELDAIDHYEQALALGLEGTPRREALLGLGSSYRCVERFADAVRTFERGRAEFPLANEFDVFMAMALHNLGEHRRAVQLLMTHIAAHTSDTETAKYQRALYHYADHPDPGSEGQG